MVQKYYIMYLVELGKSCPIINIRILLLLPKLIFYRDEKDYSIFQE